MKLFLSDLDNTLLYSYKHRATDDVCIEYNKGKEQGFMTSYSFDLFNRPFPIDYLKETNGGRS